MQHLETERLAALTDDPPTHDELGHLAVCKTCRAERDAFAKLSGLAMLATNGPVDVNAGRLTQWSSLSQQLRAEGLITGEAVTAEYPVPLVVRSIAGGAAVSDDIAEQDATAVATYVRKTTSARTASDTARPRMWSLLPAPYLQIAAALTLVVGGLAGGRMSAGAPVIPVNRNMPTVSISNASLIGSFAGDNFSSVDEATQTLSRAQRDFERASLWLANHDTSVTPEMYRKRLAGLDQMMALTREAMHEAPQDVVLSNYYNSASSARETTLRQLSAALPVTKTIERF